MTRLKSVTDNSRIDHLSEYPIVKNLINKDLAYLNQSSFIIFPENISEVTDLQEDQTIFTQKNGEVRTSNVVGFLSDGVDELSIKSRFSNELNDDYFLQYMLQKVLNYNVIKQKINSSNENGYYDLLVFLFPYYLNKAVSQGVYKEYVKKQFNDANIKGTLDISRHIKSNVPFRGNVAYTTREFNFDNNVTELIRHTIDTIYKTHEFLFVNPQVRDNVRSIKEVTKLFNVSDRERIVQNNILNPVKHSYYSEYAILQKLCLKILNHELVNFGSTDETVNGIIFDVAWLWEEYIWKITEWDHYGRKKGLKTLDFFEILETDNQQHRYPDFAYKNIPIDTKYKRNLDKRNDYNQMTTYMHMMSSTRGMFLQPSQVDSGNFVLGTVFGGGEISSYKFKIPQIYSNYEDFVSKMEIEENKLQNFLEQ